MLMLPSGCAELCGNERLSEHPSPDGRLNAVVFQRECGATTGFGTHVSLLRAGERLPNESGNILVADTGGGSAPSAPSGGPTVLVRWTGGAHLVLRHHPRARIFRTEARRHGVEIQHESFW
jgi:hypothetical protein